MILTAEGPGDDNQRRTFINRSPYDKQKDALTNNTRDRRSISLAPKENDDNKVISTFNTQLHSRPDQQSTHADDALALSKHSSGREAGDVLLRIAEGVSNPTQGSHYSRNRNERNLLVDSKDTGGSTWKPTPIQE